MDDPKVYYNEDYRNYVRNQRSNFNELATALLLENKIDSARKITLYNLERIPDKAIPYDYSTAFTVQLLFEVGEKEKAVEIAKTMATRADELATYYVGHESYNSPLREQIVILQILEQTLYKYGEPELAKTTEDALNKYSGLFQRR